MHIFYNGLDGKVYGPKTESQVQGWYMRGHFSSDIKFQISQSDQVDPDGQFYSLGELVDMNGRALPFYFSSERENRETMLEEKISRLEQEVESLRTANESNQDIDFTSEKQMIVVLKSQVASLLESHAELLSGRQRETPSASPELEKNVSELKKKIGEQEKALASMKKSNTELLDKVSSLTGRQKESATASQQLEKILSELKKKIGEQEKALSSMKKELSAANSKCDRCDSKLEKSIEKQNVMEESVIGHDRRMTRLSASMMSIRAALTSVEEIGVKPTATAPAVAAAAAAPSKPAAATDPTKQPMVGKWTYEQAQQIMLVYPQLKNILHQHAIKSTYAEFLKEQGLTEKDIAAKLTAAAAPAASTSSMAASSSTAETSFLDEARTAYRRRLGQKTKDMETLLNHEKVIDGTDAAKRALLLKHPNLGEKAYVFMDFASPANPQLSSFKVFCEFGKMHFLASPMEFLAFLDDVMNRYFGAYGRTDRFVTFFAKMIPELEPLRKLHEFTLLSLELNRKELEVKKQQRDAIAAAVAAKASLVRKPDAKHSVLQPSTSQPLQPKQQQQQQLDAQTQAALIKALQDPQQLQVSKENKKNQGGAAPSASKDVVTID